jgi:hypothetical protein
MKVSARLTRDRVNSFLRACPRRKSKIPRENYKKTQNFDSILGKKLFTGAQARVILPES